MEDMNQNDRMTLIRTGFTDPVAIALAGSLLQEAEIPYFVMDANVSNRQESGNVIGWWNISVPERSEDEVRAILDAVMQPNKETVPGELPPGAEANHGRCAASYRSARRAQRRTLPY